MIDELTADLLEITSVIPLDVPGVISTMERIDALLPASDGLKWFNVLYLMVTRAVWQDLNERRDLWSDPTGLATLDLAFAKLYFGALGAWLSDPGACPAAWKPL